MIIKAIPNAITLLNLLCGCIGIVCAFNGKLDWAGYLIGIAALFDFFDGFLARLLNAYSEIGKQLDSLADAVSFGVLPGIVLFQLLSISFGEYFTTIDNRPVLHVIIEFIAFSVPLFSVLRLAKFNIDENQAFGFIGVPTPASAILIGSLPIILQSYDFNFYTPLTGDALAATATNLYWGPLKLGVVGMLQNTWFLCMLALTISALLVAPIPLIALKFKGIGWNHNKDKFVFLGIVFILILITAFPYVFYIKHFPVLDFLIIPIIIVVYILFSILFVKKQ